MTAQSEDFSSPHEVHAPGEITDSIVNLPQQEADKYDQIAMGPVSMPLEIDGEIVHLPPRQVELEPDDKEPGKFKVFLHEHKKEAKILGTVTAAAILTGVAAIGYAKTKKK